MESKERATSDHCMRYKYIACRVPYWTHDSSSRIASASSPSASAKGVRGSDQQVLEPVSFAAMTPTVSLFRLVHSEAQRIAIQPNGRSVRLTHMQRHKLGAKDVAHRRLCSGQGICVSKSSLVQGLRRYSRDCTMSFFARPSLRCERMTLMLVTWPCGIPSAGSSSL